MQRLNRIDAQLAHGHAKPQRKAALEKRRIAMSEKLLSVMQGRVARLEGKLAHTEEGERRSLLEERLATVRGKIEMIDMPFEERARACLETEQRPMVRAQLKFWLERDEMKTMSPEERQEFVKNKVEMVDSPVEKKLWKGVLQRGEKHRRPGRGNIQQRMLRIQTRLENTNDESVRKMLQRRLKKLEMRADPELTREMVHEKLNSSIQQRRAHRAGKKCVANRIENIKKKLETATEAEEVDRLTKRLEMLNERPGMHHGPSKGKHCGKQGVAKRIEHVKSKLEAASDADEIARLTKRLEHLQSRMACHGAGSDDPQAKKCGGKHGRGPNRGRHRRIHRLKHSLAICTNPEKAMVLQARLDQLEAANQTVEVVDDLSERLEEVSMVDADIATMDKTA